MFTSWRFLQIGVLATTLSACAAQSSSPVAQAGTTPASPPSTGTAVSPAEASLRSSDLTLDVQQYVQALASERRLPAEQLGNILSSARFDPTVARLIAPAAAGRKVVRSWTVYRQRVVEPVRIRWGNDFWTAHRDTLDAAAQRFGVPPEIIVAIIGVETNYARNMGSFPVLDALYTLAFRYPDANRPDRQQMFRNQLSAFLDLLMQNRLDVTTQGSFAGAIGMAQFMPGSIQRYAIDGDGNGVIDLANSEKDAIYSIANFLVEHGWQRGVPVFAPVTLPIDSAPLVDGGLVPKLSWTELQAAGARASGDPTASWVRHPLGIVNLPDEQHGTVQYRSGTPNFFALTHYNRSYFYATSVADLAQSLAQGQARQARVP